MIKKTITYHDLDGNEVTDTFYFGFTKAELIEMEVSERNGLSETLAKVIKEQDPKQIIMHIKSLILKAHGIRGDDNKQFIKDISISKAFEQTEAYSELFIELSTDSKAAAEFINGIMPRGMVVDTDQLEIPGITDTAKPQEELSADISHGTDAPVDDSPKDPSEMSREELIEAFRKKSQER